MNMNVDCGNDNDYGNGGSRRKGKSNRSFRLNDNEKKRVSHRRIATKQKRYQDKIRPEDICS